MMESLGVFALTIAAVVVLVYAWGCWQARQSSSLRYTRNTFLASLGLMVGVATAFAGGLGFAIGALLALVLLITMNSVVGGVQSRSEDKAKILVSLYLFVGFMLARVFDSSYVPWFVMAIVVLERVNFYIDLRKEGTAR